MLIDRRRSQLLLIDIQTKLAPHVAEGDRVVANCTRLARYARRLGVPATLTEHYPKGLGPTVDPILAALDRGATTCPVSGKSPSRRGRTTPSVAGSKVFAGTAATRSWSPAWKPMSASARPALDLLAAGLEVFLVADAVGSRVTEVRDVSDPPARTARRPHRHARDGRLRMARARRYEGVQGSHRSDKVEVRDQSPMARRGHHHARQSPQLKSLARCLPMG